jgi:hypothetical protein
VSDSRYNRSVNEAQNCSGMTIALTTKEALSP